MKDVEDISKVYLTDLGDGEHSTEIKIDLASKKYLYFKMFKNENYHQRI